MRSQRVHTRDLGVRAAALMMLALVLMLQLVAASSRLHEKLHHGCHNDSPCAVELWLSTGGGGDLPQPISAPTEVHQLPLPEAEMCLEQVAEFVPTHFLGGIRANAPPRAPSV